MIDRLLIKLTQESTWRGLIALVTAFGMTIDPTRAEAIVAAGITAIGIINILKDD